jgi:hypothetical protein
MTEVIWRRRIEEANAQIGLQLRKRRRRKRKRRIITSNVII